MVTRLRSDEGAGFCRICSISPYAPNSVGFGGIARSSGTYLKAVSRLGIYGDFISSTASLGLKASKDELQRRFPNIRVHLFNANLMPRWGIGLGFFVNLHTILRAHAVLLHGTRTMPTVVGGLVCRSLGKPYAVIGHAQLDASRVARTRAKRRWLFSLTESLVRWSVKGARALILSGMTEKRDLLSELAGLPVVVIENFFDFDMAAVHPRPLGLPRIYLFVGRIESDKGVLAFSRAWRATASSSSRLWIVGNGDGSYADMVKAEVAQDPRIVYHGEVERDRVAEFMRKSSVLVLPTGMDEQVTENFGNVVVESFIAGRPVMVTTGLHWDQYAREPGIIRFSPTIDAASDAIRAFEALDSEAYALLSQSAAELAGRFHIDWALPKVLAVLQILGVVPPASGETIMP